MSRLSFLEWYHNLQLYTSITTLDIRLSKYSAFEFYPDCEWVVLPLPSCFTTLKLSVECSHGPPLLLHSTWTQLQSLTLFGDWRPVWAIPRNSWNERYDTGDNILVDFQDLIDVEPFVFPHLTHLRVILNQERYPILRLFDWQTNYLPSLTSICVNESVPDEELEYLKHISTTLRTIALV
jgi:hypothetical protein